MGDAARLEKNNSKKASLDHIIKERYPTFVDALRDLDDALSLLFLFSNLPSTSTVPPKTVALCQRLCLEFQHYLIVSHSLRKTFLSIKGIYYQATIQGQDILWLVPYKFVQRMTSDIDFKIMGTFVEFYTTLLGFVNFRLYMSIGLVYPPKFNDDSDQKGGELGAYTVEARGIDARLSNGTLAMEEGHLNGAAEKSQDLQAKVAEAISAATQAQPDPEVDRIDDLDLTGNGKELSNDDTAAARDDLEVANLGGDILPEPQANKAQVAQLFAPFKVFLSRETPRQPLEFLLKAFGCKNVGWDAILGDGSCTNSEGDPTITHQIVDRPTPSSFSSDPGAPSHGYRYPNRIYIQPQWVWDCVNECKLLRPDLYAPGATLPPHLSPWVKPTKGVYNPLVPLVDQVNEGEAEAFVEDVGADKILDVIGSEKDQDDEDSDADGTDDVDNENSEDSSAEDDFVGFDDAAIGNAQEALEVDSEHEGIGQLDEQTLYQAELEAEAAGLTLADYTKRMKNQQHTSANNADNKTQNRIRRKRQEEKEELERRKGMLSRKKRKLYEKMMYGKDHVDAEAQALRAKRRKIEAARTRAG